MIMLHVCILSITAPLFWELWNDRNGDAHVTRGPLKQYQLMSKQVDVSIRIMIACAASVLNSWNGINFWAALAMCGATHFLFFDYTIVFILVKRGIMAAHIHWYTYLGDNGVDDLGIWKRSPPWLRLGVRLTVFTLALIWYGSQFKTH